MEDKFEEVNLFEDEQPVDEQAVEVIEDPAPDEEEYKVPDKFQGKSFEDVVEAYVNLEKESGRKANEIGELRKLTDEILRQQVSSPAPAGIDTIEEDIGFDDLIDNPNGAIEKALSKNPRLQKIEEALERDAAQKAQKSLQERHPDFQDVVNSSDFATWVQASPTRLRMFQEANSNYDASLGSDLLDIYKGTHKMSVEEAEETRDRKAANDLKKAKVERGSPEGASKKVYRRADLIRLKIQDPARYAAMGDEIRQAYAEKRVK